MRKDRSPVPTAAPAAQAAKRVRVTIKTVAPAAPEPVRVVPEPVFAAGRLWRMSGKHGVAYVRDAALAGELLAVEPKNLGRAAMAVYYDRRGKAFAWQVRFDTDRWDEVMRRLA